MRVFLDANVLFSASSSGSAMAHMIADATEKAIVMTSDVACAEARKNLFLKRSTWVPSFEELLNDIEVVHTSVFKLPVALADKDVPVLCAAIRAECDLFVTGDRTDFGHLFGTKVLGVEIITPLGLGQRLKALDDE